MRSVLLTSVSTASVEHLVAQSSSKISLTVRIGSLQLLTFAPRKDGPESTKQNRSTYRTTERVLHNHLQRVTIRQTGQDPVSAYSARSSFKIMDSFREVVSPCPPSPDHPGQQTRCLWFVDLSPRRPSEAGGGHRQELPGRGVDARAVLDQLHRPTSCRLRLDGCYLNGR